MIRINVEDILEITRDREEGGYVILFANGNQIWITKRRAIPALLILLKYGDACEANLQCFLNFLS